MWCLAIVVLLIPGGFWEEKVIAEAFNWFLTSTLFYSKGFGSQRTTAAPFCVVKSVSIGT